MSGCPHAILDEVRSYDGTILGLQCTLCLHFVGIGACHGPCGKLRCKLTEHADGKPFCSVDCVRAYVKARDRKKREDERKPDYRQMSLLKE